MSDILRYKWTSFGPMLDEGGPYVLASDAEAAIAAAEQKCGERSHLHYMDGYQRAVVETRRKWQDLARDNWSEGHQQGQRDMLAKCIAAVERIDIDKQGNYYTDDLLAALRALSANADSRPGDGERRQSRITLADIDAHVVEAGLGSGNPDSPPSAENLDSADGAE